jgi:hypothetical protein
MQKIPTADIKLHARAHPVIESVRPRREADGERGMKPTGTVV